jgi:ferredoxin
MVYPTRPSRSNLSNARRRFGETSSPNKGGLALKSTPLLTRLPPQNGYMGRKRPVAGTILSQNYESTQPSVWIKPSLIPDPVPPPRKSQPIAIVSRGRTLIVGHDTATVCACAERLAPWLDCLLIVLAPEGAAMPAIFGSGPFKILRCRRVTVRGHFGAFDVRVIGRTGWVDLDRFISSAQPLDLVLDLTDSGVFQGQRIPRGFFAVGADEQRLAQALLELPEMVGTFRKSHTIECNPIPCGHSHTGLAGCRRCLQVCPCDAIKPDDGMPRIDPLACEGCAACAAACPSGTLRFRCLPHEDLLTAIRLALEIQAHPDAAPVLALFQGPPASRLPIKIDPPAGVDIVALSVPEIGCISLEIVLTALAYGAGGVLVLLPIDTPRRVGNNLKAHVHWAGSILTGLGRSTQSVQVWPDVCDAHALEGFWSAVSGLVDPAGFSPFHDKRTLIRLAVEKLAVQSRPKTFAAELPADAPFGAVRIHGERCSLCRACTDACAPQALRWEQEIEDLRFVEANCTQCGLCAKICPDQAIELIPRFMFDRHISESPMAMYLPPGGSPPAGNDPA